MKTCARSVGGCLAVAVAVCFLLVARIGAQGGIEGTGHDFSNDGANTTAVGVCTFCHTPHKADQTRLLWNHTLSANTFGWDVATTTGGTTYSTIDTAWQGSSKFCLSCHDGSVAIGDVAWFDAAAHRSTGTGALNPTTHSAATDPFRIADPATGSMTGNHPVAHPFPFGGSVSTYNGVTTGAEALLSGWQADPSAAGIRLFNDSGGNVSAGAVSGSTGIECSSCHDPHNGPAVEDVYFLRGAISGDSGNNYICLKCHDK